MELFSVTEFALKHSISPRTVRSYCKRNLIKGAFIIGKTWNIPHDAKLPTKHINKKKQKTITDNSAKTIAIVGAGFSGCFAAIRIKEKHPNFKVIIFEKNSFVGRKILATGNGKCNYANIGSLTGIYNNDEFTLPIINDFDAYEIIHCFEKIGIRHKVVGDLIYPYSESAETVVYFLRQKMEQLKIDIHLNERVIDYSINTLTTNIDSYYFDSIVFSCGGKASPKLGSDGNLFQTFVNHGYRLINPSPSLCPIKVKENVKRLSGLRFKVSVSLLHAGVIRYRDYGELLFKDDGLSGIVIFNLTHWLNMLNTKKKISICVDFAPGIVDLPTNRYREYFHQSLCEYLKKEKDIHNVCFTFKDFYPFDNAQVTSGGISIKEVNNTLESRKEKNVYFIGEVLDVDAPCGGYNIMWALASAEKISNNSF